MKCAHCGMSCTKKGEDMSIETFRNALKNGDEHIAIGGGEPTLHPQFWQILGESIAAAEYVWMATNGSITPIAMALAGLAKKGVLGVALSLDEFHDPIDPKVVEAFQRPKGKSILDDNREIRNVSGFLVKSGRCKDGRVGCICSEMVVKPNGDVRGCGCKKAPCYGNVNGEWHIPDEFSYGECSVKKT